MKQDNMPKIKKNGKLSICPIPKKAWKWPKNTMKVGARKSSNLHKVSGDTI